MTEEDWGEEAPLKVRAEERKIPFNLIVLEKTVKQRSSYQSIAQDNQLAG